MPDDKPAGSRIVDRSRAAQRDERAEVVAGLLARPATVAPRYFYDELGCALYSAICRLPEYYPTRTEVALFRERRGEIAEAAGAVRQFVDLGAGDCCKAQSWLPFLEPARYIAVDIAADNQAYPTWKQPLRAFFRRDGGNWKLVGLERLPQKLPAAAAQNAG